MKQSLQDKKGCLLFDWGDTLMVNFPDFEGPMSSWPEVALVDHAADCLAQLQDDWVIALATNATASTEADIKTALAGVNIAHYFDKIYCFKSVGFSKPSIQFFE